MEMKQFLSWKFRRNWLCSKDYYVTLCFLFFSLAAKDFGECHPLVGVADKIGPPSNTERVDFNVPLISTWQWLKKMSPRDVSDGSPPVTSKPQKSTPTKDGLRRIHSTPITDAVIHIQSTSQTDGLISISSTPITASPILMQNTPSRDRLMRIQSTPTKSDSSGIDNIEEFNEPADRLATPNGERLRSQYHDGGLVVTLPEDMREEMTTDVSDTRHYHLDSRMDDDELTSLGKDNTDSVHVSASARSDVVQSEMPPVIEEISKVHSAPPPDQLEEMKGDVEIKLNMLKSRMRGTLASAKSVSQSPRGPEVETTKAKEISSTSSSVPTLRSVATGPSFEGQEGPTSQVKVLFDNSQTTVRPSGRRLEISGLEADSMVAVSPSSEELKNRQPSMYGDDTANLNSESTKFNGKHPILPKEQHNESNGLTPSLFTEQRNHLGNPGSIKPLQIAHDGTTTELSVDDFETPSIGGESIPTIQSAYKVSSAFHSDKYQELNSGIPSRTSVSENEIPIYFQRENVSESAAAGERNLMLGNKPRNESQQGRLSNLGSHGLISAEKEISKTLFPLERQLVLQNRSGSKSRNQQIMNNLAKPTLVEDNSEQDSSPQKSMDTSPHRSRLELVTKAIKGTSAVIMDPQKPLELPWSLYKFDVLRLLGIESSIGRNPDSPRVKEQGENQGVIGSFAETESDGGGVVSSSGEKPNKESDHLQREKFTKPIGRTPNKLLLKREETSEPVVTSFAEMQHAQAGEVVERSFEEIPNLPIKNFPNKDDVLGGTRDESPFRSSLDSSRLNEQGDRAAKTIVRSFMKSGGNDSTVTPCKDDGRREFQDNGELKVQVGDSDREVKIRVARSFTEVQSSGLPVRKLGEEFQIFAEASSDDIDVASQRANIVRSVDSSIGTENASLNVISEPNANKNSNALPLPRPIGIQYTVTFSNRNLAPDARLLGSKLVNKEAIKESIRSENQSLYLSRRNISITDVPGTEGMGGVINQASDTEHISEIPPGSVGGKRDIITEKATLGVQSTESAIQPGGHSSRTAVEGNFEYAFMGTSREKEIEHILPLDKGEEQSESRADGRKHTAARTNTDIPSSSASRIEKLDRNLPGGMTDRSMHEVYLLPVGDAPNKQDSTSDVVVSHGNATSVREDVVPSQGRSDPATSLNINFRLQLEVDNHTVPSRGSTQGGLELDTTNEDADEKTLLAPRKVNFQASPLSFIEMSTDMPLATKDATQTHIEGAPLVFEPDLVNSRIPLPLNSLKSIAYPQLHPLPTGTSPLLTADTSIFTTNPQIYLSTAETPVQFLGTTESREGLYLSGNELSTLPSLSNSNSALPGDAVAFETTLSQTASLESPSYDQQLRGSPAFAWQALIQPYNTDTVGDSPILLEKDSLQLNNFVTTASSNWKIVRKSPENVQESVSIPKANWTQKKPLFRQILENWTEIRQTKGDYGLRDTKTVMKGNRKSSLSSRFERFMGKSEKAAESDPENLKEALELGNSDAQGNDVVDITAAPGRAKDSYVSHEWLLNGESTEETGTSGDAAVEPCPGNFYIIGEATSSLTEGSGNQKASIVRIEENFSNVADEKGVEDSLADVTETVNVDILDPKDVKSRPNSKEMSEKSVRRAATKKGIRPEQQLQSHPPLKLQKPNLEGAFLPKYGSTSASIANDPGETQILTDQTESKIPQIHPKRSLERSASAATYEENFVETLVKATTAGPSGEHLLHADKTSPLRDRYSTEQNSYSSADTAFFGDSVHSLDPLKSKSSEHQRSLIQARISVGSRELLLTDRNLFELGPDGRFSLELKVNSNSWIFSVDFMSRSDPRKPMLSIRSENAPIYESVESNPKATGDFIHSPIAHPSEDFLQGYSVQSADTTQLSKAREAGKPSVQKEDSQLLADVDDLPSNSGAHQGTSALKSGEFDSRKQYVEYVATFPDRNEAKNRKYSEKSAENQLAESLSRSNSEAGGEFQSFTAFHSPVDSVNPPSGYRRSSTQLPLSDFTSGIDYLPPGQFDRILPEKQGMKDHSVDETKTAHPSEILDDISKHASQYPIDTGDFLVKAIAHEGDTIALLHNPPVDTANSDGIADRGDRSYQYRDASANSINFLFGQISEADDTKIKEFDTDNIEASSSLSEGFAGIADMKRLPIYSSGDIADASRHLVLQPPIPISGQQEEIEEVSDTRRLSRYPSDRALVGQRSSEDFREKKRQAHFRSDNPLSVDSVVNPRTVKTKLHSKRDTPNGMEMGSNGSRFSSEIEPSPPSVGNLSWPWLLFLLAGNLEIASKRERDFAIYIRLNLAARVGGTFDDFIVNRAIFWPDLIMNVSVQPALFNNTWWTFSGSNITLLHLSGYDFNVIDVVKELDEFSAEPLVQEKIWEPRPVLWSAIGTVTVFCVIAAILAAILHCRWTNEAAPLLITSDNLRTKPPPPPPVIYSRRLADEMNNFRYFNEVFRERPTDKNRTISALSAKLALSESSYKNSFVD